MLAPNKISQILCLGNLTDRETYEYLRSVAPDVQAVKGDFDVEASSLPLNKVIAHGNLRIGFTHGHTIIPPADADALLIAARHMDVDVLLYGGTMKFEAYELEGRFFVNPGSATGAMSTSLSGNSDAPQLASVPSFCLMDVSDANLKVVAANIEGTRGLIGVVRVSAQEGRSRERECQCGKDPISQKWIDVLMH